jgi:hypothetical protein
LEPTKRVSTLYNDVMRKQRVYNGCELQSPIYRQVAAEMAAKREGKTFINENQTKRGKRSKV